jgi:hypothetical protein
LVCRSVAEEGKRERHEGGMEVCREGYAREQEAMGESEGTGNGNLGIFAEDWVEF